jgi:hypothetical protein
MPTDQTPYELEFYEDEHGNEPALDFMRGLAPAKRRAIGVALRETLQHLGPDVAEGNFGRNLGDGLYEFKLDQNAEQVLRRKGKPARAEASDTKVLLRVFFHPHGRKLLLLLGGYDKGERPSKVHQQAEEVASLMVWRLRHKFL